MDMKWGFWLQHFSYAQVVRVEIFVVEGTFFFLVIYRKSKGLGWPLKPLMVRTRQRELKDKLLAFCSRAALVEKEFASKGAFGLYAQTHEVLDQYYWDWDKL